MMLARGGLINANMKTETFFVVEALQEWHGMTKTVGRRSSKRRTTTTTTTRAAATATATAVKKQHHFVIITIINISSLLQSSAAAIPDNLDIYISPKSKHVASEPEWEWIPSIEPHMKLHMRRRRGQRDRFRHWGWPLRATIPDHSQQVAQCVNNGWNCATIRTNPQ